ncbi:MAG: ATP-binding protein [Tahibacter sp.]
MLICNPAQPAASGAWLEAREVADLAPLIIAWMCDDASGVRATVHWCLNWPNALTSHPASALLSERIKFAESAILDGHSMTSGLVEGHAASALLVESDSAYLVVVVEFLGAETTEEFRRATLAARFDAAKPFLLNTLEKTRLQESVQRLEQSERLQHALFAIAEMASSEREMHDLLRDIHSIIGSLMYAENLYIALYEPSDDTIRFIYFADVQDSEKPDVETSFPLSRFENGLTWYLIRDGKPMMGSQEELARQASGPLLTRGSNSLDWLGVPMIRGSVVYGALVVQCYIERARYTAHDQALLGFVAAHVLTALERKRAFEVLERRVQQRTAELASANRVLVEEAQERLRGERLQRALLRIAELTSASSSMEQFYPAVHGIIGELIEAKNFYIALVSEDRRELLFPYWVDEISASPGRRNVGTGVTEYVMRTGKSLLIDMADPVHAAEVERLHRAGELSKLGATNSVCWLGLPLFCAGEVAGVVAVQSHTLSMRYTAKDQELLTFVAYQIGIGLERRRVAYELKLAHTHLEWRVVERTRELSEQILVRQKIETDLQQRNRELEELNSRLAGAQSQLLQSEKMASVGQLAAGVAHEINNPIGYVHSNISSLARYIQDIFTMLHAYEKIELSMDSNHPDLRQLQTLKRSLEMDYVREDTINLLNESKEGLLRVEKIVKDLKEFSHLDKAEWQRVDVHAGLDSTLNVVMHEIKYKADVTKEYGALPRIECLPFQLNQVFMNLLINAAQAIEQRGTITLRSGVSGANVWISVTDTGMGIEPVHLNRLFEPFFTTKPIGVGTGLGLSVTYGIVQTHHGSITVDSEPGKGSTFTIHLPISQPIQRVSAAG